MEYTSKLRSVSEMSLLIIAKMLPNRKCMILTN